MNISIHKYEKQYRVHVYETGPDGKAVFYSLFDYMQDIAAEHAIRLGYGRDDMMKNNNLWVLSRMYASINSFPSPGDTIGLTTWPAGTDKLFAMRNYDIRFPNGEIIAMASSSWLIIDHTTKKIRRPYNISEGYHFTNQFDNKFIRIADKLPDLPHDGRISPSFKVAIGDLDVNLHTNNVNYLKWVYNTYDLNFVIRHLPTSVEINYLAESVFGDEIVIKTSEENNGKTAIFNHSLIRANDNKDLCRVRIEWEKNDRRDK